MADNSTHAESIQNIQNNIVIAMTSSGPTIVAEAWRVVEAARAATAFEAEARAAVTLAQERTNQIQISVAANEAAASTKIAEMQAELNKLRAQQLRQQTSPSHNPARSNFGL